MSIFTYVNDILYNKSGKSIEKKEMESDFQPYMIQRWLSMHSISTARILAISTNKLYKALDNSQQWYKLFLTTVPKSKYKKFRYIKKVKTDKYENKGEMEEAIELVANINKISKREVRDYVEEYGLDLSDLKKRLKECQ